MWFLTNFSITNLSEHVFFSALVIAFASVASYHSFPKISSFQMDRVIANWLFWLQDLSNMFIWLVQAEKKSAYFIQFLAHCAGGWCCHEIFEGARRPIHREDDHSRSSPFIKWNFTTNIRCRWWYISTKECHMPSIFLYLQTIYRVRQYILASFTRRDLSLEKKLNYTIDGV